jgi:predicted Zn-dependent peptidase
MNYRKFEFEGSKIICEERKYPIVSILVASRYGSAFESERDKGIAHFIEHMLFKGTKRRTAFEISSSIERVGGEINGFTLDFMTAYHVTLPKKHFELGCDILLDIVANPKFDEKEIEKEKNVVLEEYKRQNDTPNMYIVRKIKEVLYKRPFGLPRVGNEKTIPNFSKEKVLSGFNFYSLNNLIFCVVGAIEPNDAYTTIVEKIKENGLDKRRKSTLRRPKIVKIAKDFVERRKGLKQAHLGLGFHVPPANTKERYIPEIVNCILGEGMSSKLFQEIRERRALAYTAHSYLHQERDYGFISAYIGTSKEKIKEAKAAAIGEIKKLREIKKEEIEEAKENVIGGYLLDGEEAINVAINLAMEEVAGDCEEYYNYEERIKDIKYEDVLKYTKNIGKISTVILY